MDFLSLILYQVYIQFKLYSVCKTIKAFSILQFFQITIKNEINIVCLSSSYRMVSMNALIHNIQRFMQKLQRLFSYGVGRVKEMYQDLKCRNIIFL